MVSEVVNGITVVVPCYNAEQYLDECLASITCQEDLTDLRIIVVDDGSTDSSAVIAKIHGAEVISLEKNQGACVAVDTGFAAVHTRYACLLAADDAFRYSGYLRDSLLRMELFDADWIYASKFAKGHNRASTHTVETKWLVSSRFDNFLLAHMPSLCALVLAYRNPVNSSGMVIDMKRYNQHGLTWNPWGLKSVCDGALIFQMLLAGMRGIAVQSDGIFYRTHQRQVSNTLVHSTSEIKARGYMRERILTCPAVNPVVKWMTAMVK